MTPQRWQRINEIAGAAWEREPGERARFLDEACAGDPDLRASVQALLASDESAAALLGNTAAPWTGGAEAIQAALAAASHDLPSTELADGARIGAYTITGLIGRGGMGAVYRAVREDDFRMQVAIKLLEHGAGTGAALARFRAERQILAGLQHPNIARLLDGGATAEGVPYLVMEYVEGKPLLEHAAALPVRARLELFRSICSAVQYAHDHSVVHRDIKPANILVGADGAPRLLDFGIAKLLAPSDSGSLPDLTVTGMRPMTPAYASPEQIRGEPVTPATDIYSLGVVLYELLTGRRPPPAGAFTAAGNITAGLDPDLDHIVRMALSVEPGRRYPSAGELSLDLDRFLRNQPVRARRKTLRYRARKFLRRHRVPAVVAVLGALLGLALAAGLGRFFSRERGANGDLRSIAVLPFRNLSSDREQEYFADGMTDALIDRLAQSRELRVISRTSSASFKDLHRTLPDIARSLGVRAIAEGSVSRSGGGVRLAVRLIDGPRDRPIWSGNYEGELQNIVDLQDQVAAEIADQIGVTLTSRNPSGGGRHQYVDIGAYDAYLQGRRQYFTAFTEESAQKAIAWFQQSLKLDPRFAPAYAGLADCYYLMSNIYYPPVVMMPKAKAAARSALALDDSLGGAHATLALVTSFFDFDRAAAERGFQRAIELRPSDALARLWHGLHLVGMGRFDQALAELEQARRIDPASVSMNAYTGFAIYFARRYDELIERLQPIADLNPDYHQTHAFLALAHEQRRDWAKAIAEMELAYKLDREPEALAQLGHIYAAAGRPRDARRVLAELTQIARKRYVSVYHFAVLHAGLGERDEAFRWLAKVEEDRSEWFANINVDPRLDELHSDPRFARILRIVGLGQ